MSRFSKCAHCGITFRNMLPLHSQYCQRCVIEREQQKLFMNQWTTQSNHSKPLKHPVETGHSVPLEHIRNIQQTAITNADLLMEISHLEGRLEQIQAKALAKGCDCCALPKFNDVPGAGE